MGAGKFTFFWHSFFLGVAGDTPSYYSSVFFILIKLTLACDLHIEDPQKRIPPCHPQSHFVLLSTQGHAWAWGASITGQISDRWGDLGKLPSNSLMSSSFKACLLSISVHLCKSFFFLPEFNIKTKQWGKSEKKSTSFNGNVNHLMLCTFNFRFF